MSFDALRALLKPGAMVYVGGSCGEPRGILQMIEDHADELANLRFIQQPLGAVNQRDLSQLVKNSHQTTFFMTPFLQDSCAAGKVSFVPMHMRTIFDYLSHAPIDVTILLAGRDRNGQLRYAPNVDYVDAVLSSAKQIVVEENTRYVAPVGAPLVDESGIALRIETDAPLPLYPVGQTDATSDKIGALIADLIQDGDCLQTGIGAVPAAILSNLNHCNDLGFHGGLMDEGVMHLIKSGNINGNRKQIDPGEHVLGMALGSEALHDWLADDPIADQVAFRSADYTHDFGVIRQLDQFVSINSAVEVDLMGQVNAEVAGGKQVSGTGGSVDFMRAAKASSGGRSIVALSSTARKGTVSRIVARVETATALRTDVDLVVTEFGIADLRNASIPERAERLVAIAHPDFREALRNP